MVLLCHRLSPQSARPAGYGSLYRGLVGSGDCAHLVSGRTGQSGDFPLERDHHTGDLAGVCTGILGLWLFGIAIDKLGAGRAAAFGAMVPVLVAVGGWLYLGEPVDLPTGIGCLLASLGVLLSSG